MLAYMRTSILKSDAQTVVNTVNTVGVMGKGLAAEYRRKYPEMFERYREICANQLLEIGKLWLWKGPEQWVLNFPTKIHWKQPSKLEYIDLGLRKFVDSFEERGITDIAFPRLGCGNGGLDWADVRPIMERYLRPLPIQIYIHDHEVELGQPEHMELIGTDLRANSFAQFWSDLDSVLKEEDRTFATLFNKSYFTARKGEKELLIKRSGDKEIVISSEDLHELWSVLNKGILTRRKMTGKLYDEAYYLMAVLASLPYIRPVEIEKHGGHPAIGLQMSKRSGIKSDVIQDRFELFH